MTGLWIAAPGAAWAELAADAIERALRRRLAGRDGVTLALAGGDTPRPAYERLAARAARRPDDPWARVTVLFGDERDVPPEHAASNYRMARASLLDRLPRPPKAVHALATGDDGAPPTDYPADGVDVLLVGVGRDGHILSIFPGSPLLAPGEHGLVARALAPVEPTRRLTLTPEAVRRAHEVLVLVTGAEKALPVARALGAVPAPLVVPAALVRGGTWILDEPAAGALPPDVLATATRNPELLP